MTGSLRRQLCALGIPEARQTREGLLSCFPPEFKLDSGRLDVELLAGILLQFIERGLIPPPSRDPSAAFAPGLHVCQFYRSQDELLDFVSPYFRRGIADGALCVWVVSAPMTPAAAVRAIRARVGRWDEAVSKRQVEVLHQNDCYTTPAGRMRPIDDILAGFEEMEREAKRRGFASMRAAGDTSWCARLDDFDGYAAYERRVTQVLRGRPITGLCTYALHACTEDLLQTIVSIHAQTFVRSGLSWEGFRDQREARERILSELRSL